MLMKTRSSSNRKYWLIIVILFLIIAGLVGWWFMERQQRLADETIDNYDKCVAAGYAILETYPEQCKTDDGRSFTRDISDELAQVEYTSEKGVKIQVDTPRANTSVLSPLRITGQVPGSWTFEGSFPVKIEDKNGKVIASQTVEVNGEWMTDDLVAFDTTVVVSNYRGEATLVIARDNPSGLAENDDSVRIAIKFD